MKIKVNNKITDLSDGTSLSKLLEALDMIDKKGFAIAVNDKVVRKVDWNSFELKENDKVLIITATKGG